jgi:hypothetical protein
VPGFIEIAKISGKNDFGLSQNHLIIVGVFSLFVFQIGN